MPRGRFSKTHENFAGLSGLCPGIWADRPPRLCAVDVSLSGRCIRLAPNAINSDKRGGQLCPETAILPSPINSDKNSPRPACPRQIPSKSDCKESRSQNGVTPYTGYTQAILLTRHAQNTDQTSPYTHIYTYIRIMRIYTHIYAYTSIYA